MSEVIDTPPAEVAAPEAAAPAAPAAAPAAPAAPAKSLLEKGQAAAAAPAAPEPPKFPEKLLVKNASGEVDWQASAIKAHAEGYAPLEKKLHAGEAPPKSPDDYAPELPEGLSLDTLKEDPLYQGFLKGAHARGINNAQLGWVLQTYAERMALQSSPEAAEAELRKTWPTDAAMEAGVANSYRTVRAFAGDDATFNRLHAKFGNDPDFIRFTASIAPELREDKALGGITPVESETRAALMGSQAYRDSKHPEHASVVARVAALYKKEFPG
jgi:hypothetical protein